MAPVVAQVVPRPPVLLGSLNRFASLKGKCNDVPVPCKLHQRVSFEELLAPSTESSPNSLGSTSGCDLRVPSPPPGLPPRPQVTPPVPVVLSLTEAVPEVKVPVSEQLKFACVPREVAAAPKLRLPLSILEALGEENTCTKQPTGNKVALSLSDALVGACSHGSLAEAEFSVPLNRRRDRTRRLWVHFHLHMQSPGFDLVAGLIGRGGSRVRAIADATGAKVRIRGRGSGHLEVDGVSEAPAPLMVAVTSDHDNGLGFRRAVAMVLSELQSSEQRYRAFCKKQNIRVTGACYNTGAIAEQATELLGGLPLEMH